MRRRLTVVMSWLGSGGTDCFELFLVLYRCMTIFLFIFSTECLFNSVALLLYQVQHAMKKSCTALLTIEKAMSIDPQNPLCKFHRATILFTLERYRVCYYVHLPYFS